MVKGPWLAIRTAGLRCPRSVATIPEKPDDASFLLWNDMRTEPGESNWQRFILKPKAAYLDLSFDCGAVRQTVVKQLAREKKQASPTLFDTIPYDEVTEWQQPLHLQQSGNDKLIRAHLIGQLADGQIIYVPMHLPSPKCNQDGEGDHHCDNDDGGGDHGVSSGVNSAPH